MFWIRIFMNVLLALIQRTVKNIFLSNKHDRKKKKNWKNKGYVTINKGKLKLTYKLNHWQY